MANRPYRDAPVDAPAATHKDPGGARAITHLMDDLVRIPGTNFTFGLDAILAFIPGLGDATGSVISGAILVQAVRQRVPLTVLARMILTIVVDWLVGMIPVIGPVADAAYRSNRKNLRLLEREALDPERTRKGSVTYLVLALVMVVGTLILLAVGAVAALYAVWRLAMGMGHH